MAVKGNNIHTPKKLWGNPDLVMAIAGIFLGTSIISLYYVVNLRQQDIGFVILSASLIYLYYNK